MTIRLENLTILSDDNDTYLVPPEDGGVDVTNDPAYRFDILSVVRHILRERSDSNIIPVVRSAVIHPTNTYGHNMQVEVTYHTRGWRAIYGAHRGERVTNVQCYMD